MTKIKPHAKSITAGGLTRRGFVVAGALGSAAVLTGSVTPALAAEKPKVGLVMKSLANEFFKQMEAGAEKYAAANADKFDFKAVGMKDERDFAAQVDAVENFVTQKYNLIVVAPVREVEELFLKIPEPGRLAWKQHQSRFEFGGFDGHSSHLALFWLNGNGGQARALEFRNESRADAGILDQNPVRLVRLGMRDRARSQRGVIEPTAQNVDQIECAHAPIILPALLRRRIPALNNAR